MRHVVIFTVLLSIGIHAEGAEKKTIEQLRAESKRLLQEMKATRKAYENRQSVPAVRCVPAYRQRSNYRYQYNPFNSYNFPPGSFQDYRINGFRYYLGPIRRRRL
jgi:hypothetical protein